MKKVLIIFCMMLFMGEVYAQQQVSDTLRFMNDYRKFVSFVVSQPSLTKPVADSLIARQDTLMHQYRSLKPRLNDLQVEEYNRLKGRYTKKCSNIVAIVLQMVSKQLAIVSLRLLVGQVRL